MEGAPKATRRACGRMFQYSATAISSLNILSSGLHSGWTSASLSKLLDESSDIPTTKDEGSWIAAAMLFGALCGAVLAGVILDRLGRKNVIILSAALFFISWMILAFAKSVPVLLVARFMAGVPDGLTFCSVPVYIAEISEPAIRGLLGSSVLVTATVGILVVNIVGSYLSITTTALIFSTVPILVVLVFAWMPESPYCLLMKGNVEQARRNLQILRGLDDVEEDLTKMKKAVEEQNANTGKFLDLFTKQTNRKALYIMLGTRGANQLSGVTAILFYAQIIFSEFSDSVSPVVSSTIYFSVQVVVSGLSCMIIDKIGRRPLMIISLVGVISALLAEGCYFFVRNVTSIDTTDFTLIPIIALVGFVVMFNLGLQTVPIVLVGEIFATNVKAFAFCLNDIYYCVVNIVLSKFFQYTKDEFGMHVPFFAFAACSILGLLFVTCYVPETKGKSLEEIQEQLQAKVVRNEAPGLEMKNQKR